MMVVTVCIAACAEGIDLSIYSDEELITMLDAVQQEATARNIERTATLPAGNYIGGRDLPVGGYMLVSAVPEEGYSGELQLWKTPDEEGEREDVLDEYINTRRVNSFYVYLEEGYELVLPFPFEATMVSQIMFE